MSKTDEYIIEAEKKGYYVDKQGNVYSKNKKLSLSNMQNRYRFTIRYMGERVTIPVHRFVAYFKCGNKIFENLEIRHLNNNSLDNTWDNIDIGTHSDNMLDIPKEQRIKRAIHASKKNIRFDDETVKKILKDKRNGMSYNELCGKYNTSKSTLSYLFNYAYYSKIG